MESECTEISLSIVRTSFEIIPRPEQGYETRETDPEYPTRIPYGPCIQTFEPETDL